MNRPIARNESGSPMEPSRRKLGLVLIKPEELHDKIAIAAYYKAEKRCFAAGWELQDWLEAEKEVGALYGVAAKS